MSYIVVASLFYLFSSCSVSGAVVALHFLSWVGGMCIQYLNCHQKSISLPNQQYLLILFSVRAGTGQLCDCVLVFQGLDMKLLVISWKATLASLHLLLVRLHVKRSRALAPGHAMPLRKCLVFHYRSLFQGDTEIGWENYKTIPKSNSKSRMVQKMVAVTITYGTLK